MDPVDATGLPGMVERGPHESSIGALLQSLNTLFRRYAQRLNSALVKDGTEAMDAPLVLETYTTATRPTASSWTGGIIYVSDGAAGSKFQGSDGASWVSLG